MSARHTITNSIDELNLVTYKILAQIENATLETNKSQS